MGKLNGCSGNERNNYRMTIYPFSIAELLQSTNRRTASLVSMIHIVTGLGLVFIFRAYAKKNILGSSKLSNKLQFLKSRHILENEALEELDVKTRIFHTSSRSNKNLCGR